MNQKIIAILLIAATLSGCIGTETRTFVCADDNSKIVLRGDDTYTVMLTGGSTYSGDYNIIDDVLVLNYLVSGTSGSSLMTIENETLIDPMGYRWNATKQA